MIIHFVALYFKHKNGMDFIHVQIIAYEPAMAKLQQCVTTYVLLEGKKGKPVFWFLNLIRHLKFMAFSFRLEDLNIKLLLYISEKQKGACNIAINQLKRFFQWLWPTLHPVLIQGDW